MMDKQVLSLHHLEHKVSQALLERELEDIPEHLPLEHQGAYYIMGLEIKN